jgi:hypothetical protein
MDAATYAATYDATYAATDAATDAATRAATYDATRDATGDATDDVVRFLLICVTASWRMHNGGSDWSAWPCRLAAYDRVYHLDLPVFAKWRHYEAAALHGASRLMHPRFVIVSDRQATVHVETIDGRGRLHCADGPARAWADGTAVWYWHGTRVPRSLIEGDGWTVDQIHAETNTEIRRCAIERGDPPRRRLT